MVYVFLADGFEEIEALAPVDLLRRAGVEVETVSIKTGEKVVNGARGISVNANITIDEVDLTKASMLVLPGGMPGTLNLLACDKLMAMVDEYAKSGDNNKRVAAICAAPAKLLGARGLLEGKKAICYPGMESELLGATVTFEPAVTDGNITTSRGMGTAVEFGLELVKLLCGEEKAKQLRESVVA